MTDTLHAAGAGFGGRVTGRPVAARAGIELVDSRPMDSGDDLKRRVRSLIVRQLKLEIDPGTIRDDTPLFGNASGGLGLDSIDALELVLGVEKEFGIKVQDEEVGVMAFASVDALCAFIRQKAA